jgi:hypothetical protein
MAKDDTAKLPSIFLMMGSKAGGLLEEMAQGCF